MEALQLPFKARRAICTATSLRQQRDSRESHDERELREAADAKYAKELRKSIKEAHATAAETHRKAHFSAIEHSAGLEVSRRRADAEQKQREAELKAARASKIGFSQGKDEFSEDDGFDYSNQSGDGGPGSKKSDLGKQKADTDTAPASIKKKTPAVIPPCTLPLWIVKLPSFSASLEPPSFLV